MYENGEIGFYRTFFLLTKNAGQFKLDFPKYKKFREIQIEVFQMSKIAGKFKFSKSITI